MDFFQNDWEEADEEDCDEEVIEVEEVDEEEEEDDETETIIIQEVDCCYEGELSMEPEYLGSV